MAQLEAQDLAQAVVDRMDDCQDARFKQVMTSLVKHAHAFVQDVQLTPDEWMTAIQFLTATLPDRELYQFFGEFDQLPPGQHDLREVGYQLWVDPENTTDEGEPIVGGIVRSEKKTLNQLVVDEQNPEQLRYDLWSNELRYVEFRYFDGVEWTTKWDLQDGNPLPQLIQITVGFEPLTRVELEDQDLTTYPLEQYPLDDGHPHPDRYSTIVRMPAADRFFSSRLQRVGREFGEQLGVGGGLK